MMLEGAGRVHKVYAQGGEIRSDTMQYPISFNLNCTKLHGGEPLPSMDLTELFPNYSNVAFSAVKMLSGRWEAREMCLLEEAPPEHKPRLEVDYGIVAHVHPRGGMIKWHKYDQLRFTKESLVLKNNRDLPLPANEMLQIGRTVRFKADISGRRDRWSAISMTPLSEIFNGRGRVTNVLQGHGWITSLEHGQIYFPFASFTQPTDPDKRMPSPELILNAEVDYEICASLPGTRGEWRSMRVKLLDE